MLDETGTCVDYLLVNIVFLRALTAGVLLSPGAVYPSGPSNGPDPSFRAKPQADESATGWACTAQTLLDDSDSFCAFESSAKVAKDIPKQVSDNLAVVGALANGACASAARLAGEPQPDKVLADVCTRDFKAAAQRCANAGYPLVDSEGRFAESAQECYREMAEVLRKVRLMASISARCCRCMAAARCGESADRCNRALTSPTPQLPACAPAKCEAACSHFVEPASQVEPEPRSPPPSGHRPIAI